MKRLLFYQKLDKIPFLKTMAMKVIFIAFIGIHLPLLLLVILLVGFQITSDALTAVVYLLFFTLIASLITLYFLNKLIQPVRYLSLNLRCYVSGLNWNLPKVDFRDETGSLFRDVTSCVETLENAIQEKNDLYQMLSHDLKGTLAALQAGYHLHKLENKELSEEEQLKMEMVERQIMAINSLLYLYRSDENGILPDHSQELNLKQLTDDICALFYSALLLENKQIEADIPHDVAIQKDRFVLRHLLFNLIDNAVKYSRRNTAIKIGYRDGAFSIQNVINAADEADEKSWKQSTGLGQKIISKTALDLGCRLQTEINGNDFRVRVAFA
ncbi:MAG: sensor histidine kinase [Flavobacteriales bacterium]|nr:sensor histidine kinase [Flavobacteriales bacterium]